MAFIKIEGFAGNVYVPETNKGRKKHPCSDCYSCLFCDDEKCKLCLKKTKKSESSEDYKNDRKVK